MKNNLVYTIGHSNHSFNNYLSMLKYHSINLVVDVRSIPYSKHAQWSKKSSIENSLLENSIKYKYLGDKLGGKSHDENVKFENGMIDYELYSKTIEFKNGIKELTGYIMEDRTCIMCSESNAYFCHRFSLISRWLTENDYKVLHINYNGNLISNSELENTLLLDYKKELNQLDLFEKTSEKNETLSLAYRLHNQR